MVDSVKPIRAALRALHVLAELNRLAPASAAEISRHLKMSRATTYRFLETLVDGGYVGKQKDTGRYVPTHLVRTLSCGFIDDSWLVEIATPIMRQLGQELMWPVAIATLSGTGMLLRQSTDMESPLAVNRFATGERIGLVNTASGLVYLAYCEPAQQETLLGLSSVFQEDGGLHEPPSPTIGKDLAHIRASGYAMMNRSRRVSSQSALAVPVLVRGRIIASLSVRYAQTAVPDSKAKRLFLPRLRTAAEEISVRLNAVLED